MAQKKAMAFFTTERRLSSSLTVVTKTKTNTKLNNNSILSANTQIKPKPKNNPNFDINPKPNTSAFPNTNIKARSVARAVTEEEWKANPNTNMKAKFMARTVRKEVSNRTVRKEGSNAKGSVAIFENVKNLCKEGQLNEALGLLKVMEERGIRAEVSTYASLLQCCVDAKALVEGKAVHNHMIENGFKLDMFLSTKLVVMYSKCGSLGEARRVLDEMPERTAVSWTAMIAGYAKQGLPEEALKLYYELQRTGLRPDKFTFASILPACAQLASLEKGKKVHKDIKRKGLETNVYLGSGLVDMYVKCGSIEDARKVFDKMPERNVVSWTAIVAGYAQNGQVDQARKLFDKMPERNAVSWNAMLAGYTKNGLVDEARKLFDEMPERTVVSWNSMIAGYSQSGNVGEALKLFEKAPSRDVISWNTMISTYSQNGCFDEAFSLYKKMHQAGVKPNPTTFASMLSACANSGALQQGKCVHEDIVRSGVESRVFVGSALVDMYCKCGSLEDGRKVFDKMSERNVVSWTVMIAGYTQNEDTAEALKIFDEMPKRSVVSWNAVIAGTAQNGYFSEALKLFQQMQLSGVKPNPDTFASILPACANMASIEQGKEVHENIIRSGCQFDVFAASALVDMYGKCGSLDDACRAFRNIRRHNVVSWTVMIAGYAMHGYADEALQLFEKMQNSGTNPDSVTFIGVLSACGHVGLVDDGWKYFDLMSQYYHIKPSMEHYACMVNLLGRAGYLYEAQDFIENMPIKPDATIWGSLLGACKTHANIDLGEFVANRLFELDPANGAPYVLLSNMYAEAGKWDGIINVRKVMKDRQVEKEPGCSWIELNNQVHPFLVGNEPN